MTHCRQARAFIPVWNTCSSKPVWREWKTGKKVIRRRMQRCAVWFTDLRLFCSFLYSTVYVFFFVCFFFFVFFCFCFFLFFFLFFCFYLNFTIHWLCANARDDLGFHCSYTGQKPLFPRWRKYINVNKKLSRSKCPIVQSDLNHHCNQN